MYQNKKVILTICARGGSRGIPRKNLQLLAGKPLIYYTLEQIKQLPWVDRVVVSTDDKEIKGLAESFGIEVPFLRPRHLATDTAAKIAAIKHAVAFAMKYWKEIYDIDIDLDVTSPLRSLEDIENCLQLLATTPNTQAVYSVYHPDRNPYFNMVELNKKGYLKIVKKLKKPIKRRQDAPTVYALNASIYVIWVKYLFAQKQHLTIKTRPYVMTAERSIDIDRPLDLEFAEFLLQRSAKKKQ